MFGIIRECKDNPDFWEGHTGYNPCGILFTLEEWDEFIASINPYQHFLDDENANRRLKVRNKKLFHTILEGTTRSTHLRLE